MYDQYIVGFMMIGGTGLGIRCGKDTTIIKTSQFEENIAPTIV